MTKSGSTVVLGVGARPDGSSRPVSVNSRSRELWRLASQPRAPQGSGGLDRTALPPTYCPHTPRGLQGVRDSGAPPGGINPFQPRGKARMAITKEAFVSALLASIERSE